MNERIQPDADLSQIKGEITHGAFANPMLQKIMRKYGKVAFGRSSACMEFESFLKQIRGDNRSGTCLEIGTFHGITAIVLSQYFDRVICVTKEDEGAKPMKRELVEFLGIKNIQFHDIKSNAEKAPIINGLEFDFCYNDGDHTNDYQTDWDLVKRCGRILQHEAWVLAPGVWNLLHALPENEVTWASVDSFAYWERADLQEKKNPHVGSSFESFLTDEGFRDEVHSAAIARADAETLADMIVSDDFGKSEAKYG